MPVGYAPPDNSGFTLDNLSFSRLDRNMGTQKQTTDVNLNDSVLRKIVKSTPGTQVSLSQYQGKTKFWQFYSGQYFENDSGTGVSNSGVAGFNIWEFFPSGVAGVAGLELGEIIQVTVACSNFDDSINSSWCPGYQRVHKFNLAYGYAVNSDPYFRNGSSMSFVGSVSGTTLTVTSTGAVGVLPGTFIDASSGDAAGAYIVEQLSGTQYGVGTYRMSASLSLPSQTFINQDGNPGSRWTLGTTLDSNDGNINGYAYFNARAASQSSGKYNNIAVSYNGSEYVQFNSYNSGNSTSSPRGVIDLLRIEYFPTRPVNSFGYEELGYVPLADFTSTTYRAAFPISNA